MAQEPVTMWTFISMFNTTCTFKVARSKGEIREALDKARHEPATDIQMFLKESSGEVSKKYKHWTLSNTYQEGGDERPVFLNYQSVVEVVFKMTPKVATPNITINIEQNLQTAGDLFHTLIERAGTDRESLHCTSRIKPLPENWEERYDESNNSFYYYNSSTDTSHIDFPVEKSRPIDYIIDVGEAEKGHGKFTIEDDPLLGMPVGADLEAEPTISLGGSKRRRRLSKRRRRVSKRKITKRRKSTKRKITKRRRR
jgi:hypothetical protein